MQTFARAVLLTTLLLLNTKARQAPLGLHDARPEDTQGRLILYPPPALHKTMLSGYATGQGPGSREVFLCRLRCKARTCLRRRSGGRLQEQINQSCTNLESEGHRSASISKEWLCHISGRTDATCSRTLGCAALQCCVPAPRLGMFLVRKITHLQVQIACREAAGWGLKLLLSTPAGRPASVLGALAAAHVGHCPRESALLFAGTEGDAHVSSKSCLRSLLLQMTPAFGALCIACFPRHHCVLGHRWDNSFSGWDLCFPGRRVIRLLHVHISHRLVCLAVATHLRRLCSHRTDQSNALWNSNTSQGENI